MSIRPRPATRGDDEVPAMWRCDLLDPVPDEDEPTPVVLDPPYNKRLAQRFLTWRNRRTEVE